MATIKELIGKDDAKYWLEQQKKNRKPYAYSFVGYGFVYIDQTLKQLIYRIAEYDKFLTPEDGDLLVHYDDGTKEMVSAFKYAHYVLPLFWGSKTGHWIWREDYYPYPQELTSELHLGVNNNESEEEFRKRMAAYIRNRFNDPNPIWERLFPDSQKPVDTE